MKYLAPILLSLTTLALPFIGNRSISWEMVALVLGYLWIGVALGEEIGKR